MHQGQLSDMPSLSGSRTCTYNWQQQQLMLPVCRDLARKAQQLMQVLLHLMLPAALRPVTLSPQPYLC
jgi:hypothetical protein